MTRGTEKYQNRSEKNLLESIKLQYLQISELECQALAEEAEIGKETNRPPRKVIFNSRDDVWDFRSDLEIPWLASSGEGSLGDWSSGEGSPGEEEGGANCTGGNNCCSPNNACSEGEGDCDSDSDCIGDLRCGSNNCQGPGFDASDDCCYKEGTRVLHISRH